MKKLIVLLAFLLLANAISLQAQQNGKKWFTEVSAGNGDSYGHNLMDNFKFSHSIKLGLGYMLTPHLGVVPASFAFNSFNRGKYEFGEKINRVVHAYLARLRERDLERYTEIDPNPALPALETLSTTTTLRGISFNPGLVFIRPDFSGLKIFTRIGALIYHSRLSIETSILGKDNYGLSGLHHQSSTDFGFSFGGGVEKSITERAALTVKGLYSIVFTGGKSGDAIVESMDGLNFYYSFGEGFRFPNFLDEKNTMILEFTGGLKLYF